MLMVTRSHGASLIELMIGIVIMAFLVAMGFPAYTSYMENSKVRSAAETFMALAQMARGEAVHGNRPVQFVLTSDPATPASKDTGNFDPTAFNWIVRSLNDDNATFTFVEGKMAAEGAGSAAGTHVQIGGSGLAVVTYTGLGTTTLPTDATFAFTNPTGGACAPAGPIRCLNVIISVGGQNRMCDPAAPAGVGDSRSCTN